MGNNVVGEENLIKQRGFTKFHKLFGVNLHLPGSLSVFLEGNEKEHVSFLGRRRKEKLYYFIGRVYCY